MKPVLATMIAAALLSGCGQRVRSVPVPVACVDTKDIPAMPESVKPRLTGNAAQDVLILADALLAWKEVAIRQRALLEGCHA